MHETVAGSCLNTFSLFSWHVLCAFAPRRCASSLATPAAASMTGFKQDLKDTFSLRGVSAMQLIKRVIAEVQQDNCAVYAASLAYYFLFALFPFFLFLTALLAYLPIPNLMDRIIGLLAEVMPGEALSLVEENVGKLVSQQRGGLLSFGIIAALWTASSALTGISDALNHAYDVEEGRPFWKVRGMAILLTVGLSIFLIASIVLLMFGPQIGGWIADLVGLGRAFEIAWNILRWPVILILVVTAVAAIYYFAPDVDQSWKWITPGSVFAVVLWILISLGFSYYVNNFGSYDKTYGSIGAIIVLLTWMYVSGFVILVGGEINAELEHASAEGKAPGEKTGA
jgi:membrane protein